MTANRRAKIEAMLNALDHSPTASTFRNAGGTINLGPTKNAIRFAGVSASCTWNTDRQLVAAWVAAADLALAK